MRFEGAVAYLDVGNALILHIGEIELAMRILLINYRYFVSGGPERYLFNLQALLESHGHEPIPFSVAYAQNRPTEYEKYFVSPPAKSDEIFFRDHTWTPSTVWKTLARTFYSPEVCCRLEALIRDTRPDCAIVLHYLKKLSPSILKSLHDAHLPFIVRLSDFQMVCPNAHLFRGNRVCELCVKGTRFAGVYHRCVQGSLAASLVDYAATSVHKALHVFDCIPLFAVPSQFMLGKMIEGGIPASRLVHIPTMANVSESESNDSRTNQILFAGRIDRLKGIELLLDAMDRLCQMNPELPWRLKIAGMGDSTYVEKLRKRAEGKHDDRVEFLGNLSMEDLQKELGKSVCTISPSLWYENMPNTVLESLARATPVIAPGHGSFPEVVRHQVTGLLFEPGNAIDLADKIAWMLEHPLESRSFGEAGLGFVKAHHSPEIHYHHVMNALATVTPGG
jgi:glycosyltransferase involved in cell wall biosynthesis